MLFLPKKHEKYCSCLRNVYQKKVLRHGIDSKNLKKIKKITVYSLLNSTPLYTPTDIYIFCKLITVCAQFELCTKGISLDAVVSAFNIKNVDRKKISAIILECCSITVKNSGYIKIESDDQNLYIIYQGFPTKALKALIKSANGTHIKTLNGKCSAIKLDCKDSQMKAQKITGGIDLLRDPLSYVKIFLSDLD